MNDKNKPQIYCLIDIECDELSLINDSFLIVRMVISKPLEEISKYNRQEDFTLYKNHWCIAKGEGGVEKIKATRKLWLKNQKLYKDIKTNKINAFFVNADLVKNTTIVASDIIKEITELEKKYVIIYVANPSENNLYWYNYIMAKCGLTEYGDRALSLSSMFGIIDMLGVNRDTIKRELTSDNLAYADYTDNDTIGNLAMFIKLKKLLEDMVKYQEKSFNFNNNFKSNQYE